MQFNKNRIFEVIVGLGIILGGADILFNRPSYFRGVVVPPVAGILMIIAGIYYVLSNAFMKVRKNNQKDKKK